MPSLDDLFKDYENAKNIFENKLEELKSISCLNLTKRGAAYCPDSEVFNIRGTRYFLILKQVYYPFGFGDNMGVKLVWKIKKKNKKQYLDATLEDVLDSSLISDKAKEEIIFNLPVFLTVS